MRINHTANLCNDSVLTDDVDDLPRHPKVRQAILDGNRDRPLTLNWKLAEPDAFDFLGLGKLSGKAEAAKRQILAEALAAGDQYTSYSRRKNFYARRGRYFPDTFTYRAIVPAVDQLAEAVPLLHEKMPSGHRGMQSRFRAPPELLAETSKIEIAYAPLDAIIVRDANGTRVAYRDNRHTRCIRRRLETINEGLLHQEIGLDGRPVREGDQLENGGRAQIRLHRVFNRGSFESGGRFYGAFWQNMPDRKRLTINGEAVVEVDYHAMHIAMLYQEIGQPMPVDPYDLDNWPRDQAKIALLIAINATSHTKTVRALADALRLHGQTRDPFKAAQALLRAIKTKHPDIAHAFGSDAGVRLMRRDSDIAERVMLDILDATGAVPLCVHDSFLVPAKHEDALREAMEKHGPSRAKTRIFPCDTAPEIRDTRSSVFSKVSPDSVSQYGMEGGSGGSGGGGSPGEVGGEPEGTRAFFCEGVRT